MANLCIKLNYFFFLSIVEPDNTFREKLQTFRKISEPQPEDSVPKGPKPPLSYKTLIGNNFSQTTTAPTPAMIAEHGRIFNNLLEKLVK